VVRLGSALVFCLVLLSGTEAYGVTVAILSGASSPALSETSNRLRGELSALRLRVLLLGRPTTDELGGLDNRAWLEHTAEARDIDAVIEVIGEKAPEAVDVWIFERSPWRSHVARVFPDPNTPDRAGTLAIRAIEVLRSYNLETDLAARARAREDDVPAADSGPVSAAPPAVEPAPVKPSRDSVEGAGVELGAGVLTGLDRVGPALLPVLGLDWRAHPLLVVHATVSGWGTEPRLKASAGTVRVAQGYGALGLCYCPTADSAIGPYLALSAGVSRTSLAGAAESPARGHDVAQWSLLLDAGAGARLRLPHRYYATLTGHLQLAQPHVTIHVVDEQIGSTGRPNLAANLTVGAWL
jgi:hypothetical protein